jgi:hypothetical protein
MLRFALLLFAIAGFASAQIVINNHATGTALSSPFTLPDSPVNDSVQVQIDVVNTGTAAVTIESAAVFGEYYSLCCETSFTLAPSAVQTLTLTFSPLGIGYMSGSLQINAQVILLFAEGLPADSLFVQTAAGAAQAHSGTPLTFTATTSAPVACLLENNWSGPVTVNSISVTGDWIIGSAPTTPVTLQAGQHVTFTLTPIGNPANSSVSGVVSIDQWNYAIVAEPSQPAVQIQVASPLKSAVQAPLSIQFSPAPTSAVTGTLQLTFDASTSTSISDPAIIFPSTGTSSVSFVSVPGQTAASFNGAASAIFQTGTTQGTIHLTAIWGDASVTSNVAITAEPVAIADMTGSRQSDSLTVTVTGFDNTRTAGIANFSFYDSQGGFIGNLVSADFSAAFNTFFFQAAYNAGGMFKMTAVFPVTGGTNQISSVQMDLENSAGDAQSSVTPF